MATLAISPASGSITAVVTTCKVSVTDADNHDASSYDEGEVPSQDEIRYYFKLTKTGVDPLISHEFSTNADGEHEWNSVIFPEDGSWTLTLHDASDDTEIATTAVTVS